MESAVPEEAPLRGTGAPARRDTRRAVAGVRALPSVPRARDRCAAARPDRRQTACRHHAPARPPRRRATAAARTSTRRQRTSQAAQHVVERREPRGRLRASAASSASRAIVSGADRAATDGRAHRHAIGDDEQEQDVAGTERRPSGGAARVEHAHDLVLGAHGHGDGLLHREALDERVRGPRRRPPWGERPAVP